MALLSRAAARDFFDLALVYRMNREVFSDNSFRIALICGIAARREGLAKLENTVPRLNKGEFKEKVLPLLIGGESHMRLFDEISKNAKDALNLVLPLTSAERDFINAVSKDGLIDPELLGVKRNIAQSILKQPMLLWKVKHVKEFRGS